MTAATSRQIDYLTSLQATVAARPVKDWTADRGNVKTFVQNALFQTRWNADELDAQDRGYIADVARAHAVRDWAAEEAAMKAAVTEHAQRMNAHQVDVRARYLTVDPATLTAAEASAAIDALKGI